MFTANVFIDLMGCFSAVSDHSSEVYSRGCELNRSCVPAFQLTVLHKLWVPFFNIIQFVLGVSRHNHVMRFISHVFTDILQHESKTTAASCDQERETGTGSEGEGEKRAARTSRKLRGLKPNFHVL